MRQRLLSLVIQSELGSQIHQQVREEDPPRLPIATLTAAFSTVVAVVAAASSAPPSARLSPSGQQIPERLRLLRQPAGARARPSVAVSPSEFQLRSQVARSAIGRARRGKLSNDGGKVILSRDSPANRSFSLLLFFILAVILNSRLERETARPEITSSYLNVLS